MRMLIYNLLLLLAAPPVRWWLRRSARYAPLLVRFDPPVPQLPARPLWLHACSVGEVNTIVPLVTAIRSRFPESPLLVSTSTLTGHSRAVSVFGAEHCVWLPFDTRRATGRFVEALNPRVLILAETELWPNVIGACHRRAIPVVLANGRLSDRHLRRYERLRWWYRPLTQRLTAAGMQSPQQAARLVSLGVAEERIRVTGNLKFDSARDRVPGRERQQLRSQHGFSASGLVLFFGSTRPGDEALASACWATLREEYPDLKLVIAPRHVDRSDEVAALFSENVLRRSQVQSGRPPRGERVFLLDTLGEMAAFLSLASVAVVGGSFYRGVDGHNPLEAAALGIPGVFGPYMANFEHPASVLLERGGALRVGCPEDLYLALSRLLGDPAGQRQMGTRARKAVMDHQGASEATANLIAAVLEGKFPTGHDR